MSPDLTVTVAAFDFDRTLSKSDCVVPFLRRFAGRWPVVVGAIRHAPAAIVGLAARDRDRLRVAATAAVLRGVAADRLQAEAESFADEIITNGLREDTRARLAWHREQGHRVVIVSASYEAYLGPIGERLGVDAVLSTRLKVGADGRLTGELDGPNCRAAEKQHRLAAWLAGEALDRDQITLWAYGDSAGDRELLDFADHPVWAGDPLASVAPTV